jgi:hypothetical protein
MKNNMKKIIITVLSFVLFFVGQSSFAATSSVTWNSFSNDCSTIAIANETQQVGFGNPCWVGQNISANTGDYIKVRIYYHNTGTSTANNTRLKIIKSGSSTNYTFSGQIVSNEGTYYATSPSAVYLTIPANNTLEFIETRWFPNQTSSNPQVSGSSILGSGLNIGNITPGWSTQGTAMAIFKVKGSTTPPPSLNCKISSFSANPSSVYSGEKTTLSWQTNNDCLTTKLFEGTALLKESGKSGTKDVYPKIGTTYILKAYLANGNLADTKYVTVTIKSALANCTILNFSATPNSINPGDMAVLNWGTYCHHTKLYEGSTYLGDYGKYGPKSVKPIKTTTYTIKGYTENGELKDTKAIMVNVISPSPTPTGSITAQKAGCSISAGSASCYIPFSWETQNPINKSSVKRGNVVVAEGNTVSGFNMNIPYGQQKFDLYNNNKILDSETVKADCIKGTSWNGSICNKTISQAMTGTISTTTPNPCVISNGASSCATNLTWTTQNPMAVSSVVYNNNNTTIVVGNGNNGSSSQRVPYGGRTYYLYNSGTELDAVTVGAVCATGSSWNGKTCAPVSVSSSCKIISFSASHPSILPGQVSVLSWKTEGCFDVSLDGANVVFSGTQNVQPIVTTTYTLNASGINSTGVSAQTTVTVGSTNSSCTISDFSASPSSVYRGDRSTISWSTSGCVNINITDVGSGLASSGEHNVYPTSTTTYTLNASDINGVGVGAQVTVNIRSSGGGGGGGGSSSCKINKFITDDSSIAQGGHATLTWDTSNCNDVSLSGFGSVSNDGSKIVYPAYTTTYTLTAEKGSTRKTEDVKITVNGGSVYNSNVITTVATNISQTGARLNGFTTNLNYPNSNVYFEYGSTVYLGSRTPATNKNTNTSFNDYISGLSSNTIYFFRAVSEGPDGISKGAIEVFRTNKNVNNGGGGNTTTIIQGNTVYGSSSPVVLQIWNKYPSFAVGDIVEYTVFYKNISSSRLTRPMVQVFIPNGLILTNTSLGTYLEENRTLSAPIQDLEAGDEGYIYLQAKVVSIDPSFAQIVTTAILVYTNPNGAQENAMAYVLNSPRGVVNNSLGASAFFGIFSGMSLICWLFLIIIILLLFLLSRKYYKRNSTTVTETHTTTH